MTPRKNESANSPRANVRLSAPPCAFAILVVEDDPDFLELLLRQISKISGANISVAHNRDEAVELLTNRSFQLVVCDWALAA
ncbi:MAG: response regulator, partial [Bdellovibrionales bacterium]